MNPAEDGNRVVGKPMPVKKVKAAPPARDAYCIFFDRASGDYAVCYDDKIIAYAPTYYHADRLVDTHIASHA